MGGIFIALTADDPTSRLIGVVMGVLLAVMSGAWWAFTSPTSDGAPEWDTAVVTTAGHVEPALVMSAPLSRQPVAQLVVLTTFAGLAGLIALFPTEFADSSESPASIRLISISGACLFLAVAAFKVRTLRASITLSPSGIAWRTGRRTIWLVPWDSVRDVRLTEQRGLPVLCLKLDDRRDARIRSRLLRLLWRVDSALGCDVQAPLLGLRHRMVVETIARYVDHPHLRDAIGR